MPRRLLSSALLLTSALVSPAALAEPKYPAAVDVFGGVNGDGPGGGLELMAPFAEGEGSLLFGLARGVLWDETGTGGVGLGYRAQALPGWLLGGYGMVDYHRGASNESYFQGVLGLEALTESFDFRVNGYLPEDDETTLANVMGAAPLPPGVMVGDIVIVDHEIGIVTGASAGSGGLFRSFERPLPGIDVEIGYRLPLGAQDFRIFLGAFYFEGGNDYENVTGPKARAEWRIHDLRLLGNNSRLTFEAGIRDDDVRGTDVTAGLRIRIPFGGVPSNQRGHELVGLDQRMLDPIRREDHIVMGEREEMQAATPGGVTVEAVKSVETDNEITSIWFADGAGGGDGTMGSETDLATAVSDPGAGDQVGRLIVAYGGNGDVTGNVTLAQNQILLGGATTLAVSNLSGAVTGTYDPAGLRPTIIDGGSITAPIIRLADGAFVTGIDLTGSNNGSQTAFNDAALYGNMADNVLLRDIVVSNAGNALVLEGGTGARVEEFSASTTYADVIAAQTSAIHLRGATGASFARLKLSGYTRAVDFQAGSSGTIRTATITNVGGGIRLDASSADIGGMAVADKVTIRDSQAGMEIQNNSTNVNARMVEIDNASTRGISVDNSTGVLLDDFTIINSDGNGLMITGTTAVAGAGRAVIARNGTLTNNGGGPEAQSDVLLIGANDVELTDITSTGYVSSVVPVAQAAVFISQSTDVAMNDVDVAGIGVTQRGIQVGNKSQNIVISGSDVTNVLSFGVMLFQVDNVTYQGDGMTPFTIQNTGGTGLYVTNARNTKIENGKITDTGGTEAYLDAGGILVQAVVGNPSTVTLSNIDVIGADSPGAEAYGVAAIAVGAPSTLDLTLDNVHIDGGPGMTTTRGFFIVDSGPTTLFGSGNTTAANVPDACQMLGTVGGSAEINGNPEPGTTC